MNRRQFGKLPPRVKRMLKKRRNTEHFLRICSQLGIVRQLDVFHLLIKAKETGFLRWVKFAKPHGFVDRVLQIDITFADKEGERHSLQVKSSEAAVGAFREAHPEIPVMRATLDPQHNLKELHRLFPCLRGFKLPTLEAVVRPQTRATAAGA